jgi:hypothetical protein
MDEERDSHPGADLTPVGSAAGGGDAKAARGGLSYSTMGKRARRQIATQRK